ncbi:hypothetical protein [Sulfurimonas sp. ST-27]|uniref:hypothetical protein n=1 Tax=Sulfurimonas sp. ST-27 TaxID=3400152 RepID=UPI003AB65D84
MHNLYEIGAWLTQHSASVIEQWLNDPKILSIFTQHKINRQKFSKNFATAILSHAVDVMQAKKEMQNCPSMNKFVDLMLKNNITADEILSSVLPFAVLFLSICSSSLLRLQTMLL